MVQPHAHKLHPESMGIDAKIAPTALTPRREADLNPGIVGRRDSNSSARISSVAPQPRSGPLLFVDGVASERSFNDVPFADIVGVHKLDGPVAAILYGRRAEVGVIEVTTRFGPPRGARTVSPVCLNGAP